MTRRRNHHPEGWVLCCMCDEVYDPNGPRAGMHGHPEPQSGAPRDAWLASRMPYEQWAKETPEGRDYARHRDAINAVYHGDIDGDFDY